MAYIYIKSGGTATGTAGKYADPKTGSWSTAFTDTSQYYNCLTDAKNSASISAGDIVYLSDIHNYSINITTNTTIAFNIENVRVISVDDDDVTVPSSGATETFTSSSSYSVYLTFYYVYGVTLSLPILSSSLYLSYSVTGNRTCIYDTCTFIISNNNSSNSNFYVNDITLFKKCTFNFGITSTTYYRSINSSSNKILWFKSCIFISYANSGWPIFKNSDSNYEVVFVEIDGCDFSQANRPLYTSTTNGYLSSGCNFYNFQRCKEATNTRSGTITAPYIDPCGYYLSGNDTKYLMSLFYSYGTLTSSTSIYRNDGATYDGTTRYCFTLQTSSSVSATNPLRIKISDFYFDFSASKSIIIELSRIVGSALLTDYDVSLELFYPEVSSSKSVRISTRKLLPSTNNLSTSSKTWTGLTTPVLQNISITSIEKGSYGLCSLYLSIYLPSVTLYVCPKLDYS
jgi:hypothetical protein